MTMRRLMFWLVWITMGLFILAPAVSLKYAEHPGGVPFWLRSSLRLNAVVLSGAFLYLWIDAWRRLFRFWDDREKKNNYVLLFFMIFASPLAAIYFYFRKEGAAGAAGEGPGR